MARPMRFLTLVHVKGRRTYSTANRWIRECKERNIVLIDGVRTPFMVAGTDFATQENSCVELCRRTLVELHNRTHVPKEEIQHIVMGTVVQDVQASNVARDSALVAGYPPTIPAHTVIMGCLGSIQSITTCVAHMKSGYTDVCVAGGTDFMSDLPIRFSRKMRAAILKSLKAKTFMDKFSILSKLGFNSLLPEIPVSKEYVTMELISVMVQRLATEMGVSRLEQDEFSLRSHQLAARAFDKGYITDIFPYETSARKDPHVRDNGIRDTSLEKLSKLKPVFPSMKEASLTAGNSTFLTDGASACLLMTEDKARSLGLRPKAYIRDFIYTAQDPVNLPLAGGVFAVPLILESNRLMMKDVQVWELIEDFAAQVVANFKAMDSDSYAQKFMNRSEKVGLPPMEQINAWGGSLSMGHPFGATGVRLLMHSANRLIKEDGELACVVGCAIGGQGVAMIIERHPDATL